MTKQEQIEEIAKDIHRVCTACSGEMFDEYTCDRCQAKLLIEKGYRKLPKDSIVLSREEYEKVGKEIINKSTYDTIWKAGYNAYEKTIGECVAEARKETAEKYHKAMRKVIHERDYIRGYAEIGLQEENDKIAEQFEVEIKE